MAEGTFAGWLLRVWDAYKESREAIVPLLTFIGAAIVAWAALRQARIARLRHEAQTKADLQRRITESFSKAIEQLSSEKLQVRLGGIYTLERISRESELDYWPVMETLTAFVRERARWKSEDRPILRTFVDLVQDNTHQQSRPKPPTDVAAVLAVIIRRDARNRRLEKSNKWSLDLRSCDLRGANLPKVHLEGANLSEAHLEEAFLYKARSGIATLSEIHLEGAYLQGASGLRQDDINSAYGDAKTLLPEGLTRPAHWPEAESAGSGPLDGQVPPGEPTPPSPSTHVP